MKVVVALGCCLFIGASVTVLFFVLFCFERQVKVLFFSAFALKNSSSGSLCYVMRILRFVS